MEILQKIWRFLMDMPISRKFHNISLNPDNVISQNFFLNWLKYCIFGLMKLFLYLSENISRIFQDNLKFQKKSIQFTMGLEVYRYSEMFANYSKKIQEVWMLCRLCGKMPKILGICYLKDKIKCNILNFVMTHSNTWETDQQTFY